MCAHFFYKMVHCRIWNWSIMGFVQQYYWHVSVVRHDQAWAVSRSGVSASPHAYQHYKGWGKSSIMVWYSVLSEEIYAGKVSLILTEPSFVSYIPKKSLMYIYHVVLTALSFKSYQIFTQARQCIVNLFWYSWYFTQWLHVIMRHVKIEININIIFYFLSVPSTSFISKSMTIDHKSKL